MQITRFAPSPTGFLHIGHAYSALMGWRAAQPDGRFLIRIDDIDETRCRPAFEAAIFEDLAWLGLDWAPEIRRQTDHLNAYRAALAELRALGLAYPCFCSRKEIRAEVARMASAPHGPDGPLYPGTCRNRPIAEWSRRVASGEPHAWRLDVAKALAGAGPLAWQDRSAGPQTADPAIHGDIVLGRKETAGSYHLSVVVDDAAQGITLVNRGRDLFAATHVHRLLQALLGLPTPDYDHHRLIADDQGERLAKRADSVSIRQLRADGMRPVDVWQMVDEAPPA